MQFKKTFVSFDTAQSGIYNIPLLARRATAHPLQRGNLLGFKKVFLLFVMCIVFAMGARGQSLVDSSAINRISPGGWFDTVYDRLGNAYPLRTLAVNDTLRAGFDSVQANAVSTCTSGYFQLYMEAGSGFEDGSGTDNARLAVLCRVLYDLSQFIQSPLGTSGQKINVWVRKNGTLNAPMMGYASGLYTTPKGESGNITDNTLWTTIQSGTDAYKNICSPMVQRTAGGTFFHVIMSFDFSAGHTWHTDLTTAPTGSEYDLYTTALREMAHALGIVSEINSDGTSLIGNSNYSRYDQYLATQGGTPLITNGGSGCSMYNYSFNSAVNTVVLSPNPSRCITDSTNCDSALQYNGSITALVYTPNCYEAGRSLSDLEDACMGLNNLYYVTSNKTVQGSMKRYLKPEEWTVLTDIGYMTDTVYGDSTNLNYYNYGSNISPTITVAGIDDGINSDGTYAYVSTGGTVTISGILSNDENANAFECMRVITGTGSVDVASGSASTTVTYTPGSGDAKLELLSYVPYNTTTGIRGNVTYVYVYGPPPEGACIAPSACEMVPDGGFESVVADCGPSIGSLIPNLTCWDVYTGSPDLFSTTCTIANFTIPGPIFNVGLNIHPPGSPSNDHYVGMGGQNENPVGIGYYVESLQSTMSAALVNGITYTISFWGSNYADNSNSSSSSYYLQLGASAGPLTPFNLGYTYTGLSALPGAVTPMGGPIAIVNDPVLNGWDYVSFAYTATSGVAGYTNFVVTAAPWYPDPTATVDIYFLLDDISIQPTTFPITASGSTCSGGSVTLSTTITGVTSYQWQLNGSNISGANSASYVTTTVGSYTLIVVVNGCSVTSNTITVDAPCACTTFGAGNYTQIGQSGTISSSITSGGNYYIGNDVTISGNLTFTDAVILMADNTTMHVGAGSWLKLSGSHLFGCDMWDGIVLDAGSIEGPSGSLYIGGSSASDNTLIEDAITAVDVENIVYTGTPTYILKSDSAIFNRNHTGIYISNYTSTTTPYPFYIANTVFTTRDVSGFTGYPGAWPSNTGTGGLKTYEAPSGMYMAPFSIDDGTYSVVACKDGDGALYGMHLNDVGAETLTNPSGPLNPPPFIAHYDYYDMTVGDGTTTTGNVYQNLFDHMHDGIWATNTNLTCTNGAFIHSQPIVPQANVPGSIAGDGILANVTNDNLYHNRLNITAPSGYRNLFFDFFHGAEVYGYYEVIGLNSNLFDFIHYGVAAQNSDYGFFVQSAKYDSINISYDSITNVRIGIAVWAEQDATATTAVAAQMSGQVLADNNLIQTINPWRSTGIEPVYLGISIQNLLVSSLRTVALHELGVHTDNNIIDTVNNGIYINNFANQAVTSTSNTVVVTPISKATVQYGIEHAKCVKSLMSENTVRGSSSGVDAYDSIRAFYSAANTNITVGCNRGGFIGRSFEFMLSASQSVWKGNTMQDANKGFVLNHGFIGTQGGNTLSTGASGNVWSGSTWGSSGPFQTFTQGLALPALSKLYVTSGSTTNPSDNSGSPFVTAPYIYSSATLPSSLGYGLPATFCPPTRIVPGPDVTHAFEEVAKDSISYGNDSAAQGWIAQMALWQELQIDSVDDSSCVLNKFDTMASLSRYNYLATIEQEICFGNYDTAQTMIDSLPAAMCPPHDRDGATCVGIMDNTANAYADQITDNYVEYYELYMKFAQDTMTGSDSTSLVALANLCPVQNGAIVYQARALYSLVYNDLTVFSDDSLCDTAVTHDYARPGGTQVQQNGGVTNLVAGQQYSLYPNPSDGNIVIEQLVADIKPVKARISDVLGQTMYNGNLYFEARKTKLNLQGVAPGTYLLELIDSSGKIFSFKFVIENRY